MMQIPFLVASSQAGQDTPKTATDGTATAVPDTIDGSPEAEMAFDDVFGLGQASLIPDAPDMTTRITLPVTDGDAGEPADAALPSASPDDEDRPILLTPEKVASIMASTAHTDAPEEVDANQPAPARTDVPATGRILPSEKQMPQGNVPVAPVPVTQSGDNAEPKPATALPAKTDELFASRGSQVASPPQPMPETPRPNVPTQPSHSDQGHDISRGDARARDPFNHQPFPPANQSTPAPHSAAPIAKGTVEQIAPMAAADVAGRIDRDSTRDALPRDFKRPAAQPVTQQPQAPATGPSLTQPIMAASVQMNLHEMVMPVDADPAQTVTWDVRGQVSFASVAPIPAQLARTELPPHIAQQIAAAMAKAPDKPIEIALNPPELGRVRMMLSTTELGVTVQVLTERADTLDLMRRNIGDLGDSLADLGYEDIAFSFGQGGDAADASQDDAPPHPATVIDLDPGDAAAPETTPTPLAHMSDGIDMRL